MKFFLASIIMLITYNVMLMASAITEEKDGFKTSYLVIPKGIDIENEKVFFITAMNNNEHGDQIMDESILEEKVTAENKNENIGKILLNDDISTIAPPGFKIVEVKVPADDNEDVKFAAGYKFQENGIVTEYVFLTETDPDQKEAENLTKEDPFNLLSPANYFSSFDDFIGIEVSGKKQYFMIPVRDTTKNYEMEFYSSEVPFKINDDGSITILAPFRLTVDILGSEYSSGTITAKVGIKKPGGNWIEISPENWSGNLRNRTNIPSYIHGESLPSGTVVGVSTKGGGRTKKSWIEEDVIYSTGNTYRLKGYMEVHRNGGEIKNIKVNPVGNQTPLENIVNGRVRTDLEDGKVYADIGDQDIIIFTEHYTDNPNSDYYDLQDLVALISITADEGAPIYRITMVHDEGLLSEEEADMIAESSSSIRQRSSEVEFRVMETGTSEVEFEITNIDE